MKKLTLMLAFLGLMFFTLTSISHASGQTICVDPGHGGTDSGAVYQTITEKAQNLDIGLRLRDLLTAAGYSVVMTRTGDISLSNAQRTSICNNAGAQLDVLIHLNASTNHSIDYTQVFYGKRNKDTDFALTLDTAMNELGITNNGITNYADGELLKVNMPAALAETVFISSDREYSLLTDGTGTRQQQIAQALFDGIHAYLP